MDWQPIETAPKPDVVVLGYFPDAEGDSKLETMVWRDHPLGGGAWCYWGRDSIQAEPTQWAPVEAPNA